ncbi:hypothetical protein AQUCO_01100171v1 [Aquilegia coerulea]|uniref:Uncharacterized protein n=1 Tax=Aquilegia coerulea TaxID=218851 RepID=A0A2G5E5V3_AQUCA|nr:hypothetical protein AQUCO_01100171v1 [Aquilegia coerulea]
MYLHCEITKTGYWMGMLGKVLFLGNFTLLNLKPVLSLGFRSIKILKQLVCHGFWQNNFPSLHFLSLFC